MRVSCLLSQPKRRKSQREREKPQLESWRRILVTAKFNPWIFANWRNWCSGTSSSSSIRDSYIGVRVIMSGMSYQIAHLLEKVKDPFLPSFPCYFESRPVTRFPFSSCFLDDFCGQGFPVHGHQRLNVRTSKRQHQIGRWFGKESRPDAT